MKAYILLCDGFEEVEALTTVDVLRRGGIEVKMVSVDGEKTVRGSHDIRVESDVTWNKDGEYSEQYNDADAVILPGGMPGTRNLAARASVEEMLRKYAAEKKVVAAICAAPSVLGKYGLLDGREATCFPGFEKELGKAIHINEGAVVAGNLVTGKSMGCAIDFALGIITALQGKEAAEELEKSLYRS